MQAMQVAADFVCLPEALHLLELTGGGGGGGGVYLSHLSPL